jgi:hypothetical protein
VQARAAVRRRPERGEEDEALDAGALGRADHPPRRDAVELLDRPAGLVAGRARQVDDGVHAAHGVAKRRRVGEVAERDLHAHAVGAELLGVAHQATHGHALGDDPPQQGRAHCPGGAGEEQH